MYSLNAYVDLPHKMYWPYAYRKSDPTMGSWPQELALRWIAKLRNRAAAIMSLIQSERLNRHDPYAYLKDVLKRLPTQQSSEISELLMQRWTRA